jgi:hypothetical protein
MAKSLDFNSLQRPTLELTMCDENKTKLRLVCPYEKLIEKLETVGPELTEIMEKNDTSAVRAVYDFAAELISCNDTGVQVTADDLRDKYRLGLDAMIIFFSAYMDFIDEEIKSAKN